MYFFLFISRAMRFLSAREFYANEFYEKYEKNNKSEKNKLTFHHIVLAYF